jgi:predicted nucleotidyltransferase
MAKPADALNQHREAIRRIVTAHRARNPRVFGSVLRAEDEDGSDLDLLVDPDEHMSGFDLGAIRHELEVTLGVTVDVLTPRALPDRWRARIEAEAQPV